MIIVVTATSKEMQAALGGKGAPVLEQGETAEFSLGGLDLLLAVSGVGLVNTALTAGRLMALPSVTGVVNLGIGGAYEVARFPIGSCVYAWRETWPEYGLLDEEGRVDPKGIGFSQGEVAGKPVWNRLVLNPVNDAATMGLSLPAGCARGSFVTVSSVTGTPERAGWLQMACSADVENMEGFALAFGAARAGLPFLQVRSVSNVAGSRDRADWDLKGALRALGDFAPRLFTGK
ncbi:futalosine hydrolase [Pseudodesulfovibrio pelocollis]|uniref:futalosine hydrolase n=1 Tax=Pseudodesulfovibrio pelocollis TaxID=3051432 RepID=UPI00255A7927|nr:futalosine hydrolase [Pseudodesulfovibrio sp. SB368]